MSYEAMRGLSPWRSHLFPRTPAWCNVCCTQQRCSHPRAGLCVAAAAAAELAVAVLHVAGRGEPEEAEGAADAAAGALRSAELAARTGSTAAACSAQPA